VSVAILKQAEKVRSIERIPILRVLKHKKDIWDACKKLQNKNIKVYSGTQGAS